MSGGGASLVTVLMEAIAEVSASEVDTSLALDLAHALLGCLARTSGHWMARVGIDIHVVRL